jgi:hypothetical protein
MIPARNRFYCLLLKRFRHNLVNEKVCENRKNEVHAVTLKIFFIVLSKFSKNLLQKLFFASSWFK